MQKPQSYAKFNAFPLRYSALNSALFAVKWANKNAETAELRIVYRRATQSIWHSLCVPLRLPLRSLR